MTVGEALDGIIWELEKIGVPVGQWEAIGEPLRRQIMNLKACAGALRAGEQAGADGPEEELPPVTEGEI